MVLIRAVPFVESVEQSVWSLLLVGMVVGVVVAVIAVAVAPLEPALIMFFSRGVH